MGKLSYNKGMTITHRSQHSTSTQRDAWVEVNLGALERNYRKLKELGIKEV